MTPADLPPAPASASLLALLCPAALVAGAAATYAGSMVLMKFWDAHGGPLLALAIAGAVVLAVILETAALREMKLGLAHVAIPGVEAAPVMLAAHGLFGESFAPRELAGAGIIVAGVAVTSVRDAPRPLPSRPRFGYRARSRAVTPLEGRAGTKPGRRAVRRS